MGDTATPDASPHRATRRKRSQQLLKGARAPSRFIGSKPENINQQGEDQ
jgi:hypothetical protein